MDFEIKIYDYDTEGNRILVENKTLNNRLCASDYVMKFQSEPKEYPMVEENLG